MSGFRAIRPRPTPTDMTHYDTSTTPTVLIQTYNAGLEDIAPILVTFNPTTSADRETAITECESLLNYLTYFLHPLHNAPGTNIFTSFDSVLKSRVQEVCQLQADIQGTGATKVLGISTPTLPLSSGVTYPRETPRLCVFRNGDIVWNDGQDKKEKRRWHPE